MTAPAPAGDWPPGRRRRRCSWVPTVSASPAAPCNTGCRGRFGRAGIDADRARGALVHGLRHTFATSSNADVSVYTLMKLLGHESMVTSQRNVTAVRAAATSMES